MPGHYVSFSVSCWRHSRRPCISQALVNSFRPNQLCTPLRAPDSRAYRGNIRDSVTAPWLACTRASVDTASARYLWKECSSLRFRRRWMQHHTEEHAFVFGESCASLIAAVVSSGCALIAPQAVVSWTTLKDTRWSV